MQVQYGNVPLRKMTQGISLERPLSGAARSLTVADALQVLWMKAFSEVSELILEPNVWYYTAHSDVPPTGSSRTLPGFGTSVLVVEDEAIILISICDELSSLGFQVYEANNAKAAIDQLLLHPNIEVLFTDIDMPGDMDGLLLAKHVRGRWPPIKIIITSGKQCFTKEELPVIGRFLPKPYAPSSVVSAIHELLAA